MSIGPPEQVHYEGSYEFILKDVDGFIIDKLVGPDDNLAAGSGNHIQSIVEGIISPVLATQTKTVDVTFTIKGCYPCKSE